MSGSYSHIVDDDGNFRMDLIENLGDAEEALKECYDLICAKDKALKEVIRSIEAGNIGDGKHFEQQFGVRFLAMLKRAMRGA